MFVTQLPEVVTSGLFKNTDFEASQNVPASGVALDAPVLTFMRKRTEEDAKLFQTAREMESVVMLWSHLVLSITLFEQV